MPISASVTNQQITATVGETQIDVSVSGGVGPTGPQGPAGGGYTLPVATGSVLGGVKIGSGVTITDGVISVSTDYAATSHNHDDRYYTETEADALLAAKAAATHSHGNITNAGAIGSTSGLPVITTTSGVLTVGAFGTSAGTFAEGNHTHAQLHDRSHAITSSSDHTAGNWKVFHSNGSGEVVEVALGAADTVLASNGSTAAPSFKAVAGGGVKIGLLLALT